MELLFMLNRIVWNGTVCDIESVLMQTELFEIELPWNLTVWKQKLYLTELFELELFD